MELQFAGCQRSKAVLVGKVSSGKTKSRVSVCAVLANGCVAQMCDFFRAHMRQSDSVQHYRRLLSFAKSGEQISILRSEGTGVY